MKTKTMIAAALIASSGFATTAMAQDTKHTLTGQEKTMRYQQDQREKAWNQERMRSGRVTVSNSYGMPNRQNPADRAQPDNASPSSFSVPGSGAAFYNYDANSKSWAYGY